ncbi:hypothetical protein GCM10020220_026460 [Nonomuraea rubra]|uniref:hypothetical protein n=1 Tax=Nonomuraea rubra TaxID=46180 RepID=UPI0031E63605
MTRTNATTGAQPPSTSNPPAGWRPALTLLVLLGPLSIAILRMLLPYGTGDSPAAVAAKVAADPVAEAAVLWLSLLAGFTLVPGMIAVGLLAARRSRVLGTAALVVSVAGFSGLPAIVAVDLVAQSGTRANVPADVTARLLRQLLDEPTVAVPTPGLRGRPRRGGGAAGHRPVARAASCPAGPASSCRSRSRCTWCSRRSPPARSSTDAPGC